jgi:hypothetical protein
MSACNIIFTLKTLLSFCCRHFYDGDGQAICFLESAAVTFYCVYSIIGMGKEVLPELQQQKSVSVWVQDIAWLVHT